VSAGADHPGYFGSYAPRAHRHSPRAADATTAPRGKRRLTRTTKRPRPAECGPHYQRRPADTPQQGATGYPTRGHRDEPAGRATSTPPQGDTGRRDQADLRRRTTPISFRSPACHTPPVWRSHLHTRRDTPTGWILLTPSRRPTFQGGGAGNTLRNRHAIPAAPAMPALSLSCRAHLTDR